MTASIINRDYSLTGEDGRQAIATGLASAEWYHSDIPRKVMKDLMGRTVLAHVIDRVRLAKGVDEIIVATSTKAAAIS